MTDKTRAILKEMLTENTGRAMLDSGDYYGRNWQKNQGKDFDNEPRSTLDGYYGISVTHSVYHWLAERLEYDPKMNAKYQRFSKRKEFADSYDLEIMESFPDWLKEHGYEVGGLYGDGDPFTVNTYNGEDMLSQVLQYLFMTVDDPAGDTTAYVILQIHGGCDVRGGYTTPRVFKVTDYDGGVSMMDNAQATVFCNHCHSAWDTYDGYHWEHSIYDSEIDLSELTVVHETRDNDTDLAMYLGLIYRAMGVLDYEKIERLYGDHDFLFIDKHDHIVCPHCGIGVLESDFSA